MQFDVYRYDASEIPFIVDIQSDLIADLSTRVVIPLYRESAFGKPLSSLTPILTVDRRRLILATPELAGVGISLLGEPVANLSSDRAAIISAIDLLITGI